VDAVRDHTGWPLKIADKLAPTPEPTAEELAMLQRFDPERYWTGS
jgi:glutaconate CoA-transferase subunit B